MDKRWWQERWAVVLILVGAVFRHWSAGWYPVGQGFDFGFHWQYATWIADRGEFPPGDLSPVSYGLPLHYVIVAACQKLGLGSRAVVHLVAALGWFKLVVVHVGMRRFMGDYRLGRQVALVLMTFWPIAIHLESMVYTEALNGLLCAGVMVLGGTLLRGAADAEASETRTALLLGAVAGAALLTKVSGVLVLAGLGSGALVRAGLTGSVRGAFRSLRPWAIAAALVLVIAGWAYVRNVVKYGSPVVTSFELSQRGYMDHVSDDYFERRPLEYYVGWDSRIFETPYYPTASGENDSRFFPVFVASFVVDYFNFAFSPAPDPGEANPAFNGKPGPNPTAMVLSRWAVRAGALMGGFMALAWVMGMARSVRRRRLDCLGLLLVPMFGVLGALHFSTKYPFDTLGVTKGYYIYFCAPVLFGLFGAIVEGAGRRGLGGRIGAGLLLAATAPILVYGLYCRFFGLLF